MMISDKTRIHGGTDMSLLSDHSINVNPMGMPEGCKKAVLASMSFLSGYPETDCRRLIDRLSDTCMGNGVILGNGSAELIYALCHHISYEHPGFHALAPAPSFTEYEYAVKASGGYMRFVPTRYEDDFLITENTIKAMEAMMDNEDIRLVFICNPNNPTGQVIERNMLMGIAARCKDTGAVMVIDECFLKFSGQYDRYTMLPLLEDNGRLLILDSFTKFYAMAGFRIGYCVSSDRDLLSNIRMQIQPWNVSKPAYEAALAAMDERGYEEETVRLINKERKYLIKGLSHLGIRVFGRPDADFVFFEERKGLLEALAKVGIGIRDCSDMMKYIDTNRSFYRAAVMGHKENEALIRALEKIRGTVDD